MKVSTTLMATEFRDQVIQAIVSTSNRVKRVGLVRETTQEDYGTAIVAGLSEALGIVLSEAFKGEPARLVESFPRIEDIIKRTAARAWQGHLPGCSCGEGQD